ncbi:MAG: chemotaxis protein CheA, partial [Halobacteriovoraceae bacterium]|nr:chemotaxis protein CheA [Halobacteriovoraceae bacterium]
MDNSALLNEFLVESFENLSSLSSDLTLYEKEPENKELLNKIYRTVHTMKGSASFLGYSKLQDITHVAENLLDELREGSFNVSPPIIDTLLDTFDICHVILKAIESNNEEGSIDIEENKSKLDKLLETKGLNAQEAVATPVQNEPQDEIEGDELSSLISGYRDEEKKLEPAASSSTPKESPTPVADAPEVGMSAAALESLKELVGDGKVDSQLLEELEGEVSTPVTKTETAKAAEVTKEPEKAKEPAVELAKKEDVFKKKAVVEKDNSDKPAAKKSLPKKENLSEDATDSNKSIADSFVRVNVKVLDRIMNIVGELVLNRNQVVQYSNLQSDHEFNRLAQQLNIITSELQSEVMSTRMQPVGNTLSKFERLVRDFSRQSGKKIMLKLSGQGTELDKTLIEAIKDPLVHIIRNACDHGLELPEEREEAGKSADGLILIKAYNESGQVVIEIVDDGRGLNKDKIMEKALEKGVMTQEKLDSMSDSQIFNLIFAAGFSTAEQITNISGRGVGMDVVKTNIERIGGTVSVSSNDGAGSTFKLRIPLTLAIVPALVIKSKNESFAIPQQNLVELVRLETAEDKVLLETIQGSEFLKLRGVLTPIFRLKETLSLDRVNEKNNQLQKIVANNSLDGASSESSERQSKENQFEDALNIVILNAEEHVFGIVVEEILDTEEIVVKPLNNSLKELTLFGGATIMGD